MYGSSLMLVTRMLRDSRIAAREAAAMPFPREETTPPVTNTYLVIYPRRVGMEEVTRNLSAPQMSRGGDRASAASFCFGRFLEPLDVGQILGAADSPLVANQMRRGQHRNILVCELGGQPVVPCLVKVHAVDRGQDIDPQRCD